ncbi:MAG TPA: tetratricopeptide repeat protein, partial [Myxococcota bacterium]|nr:tetratricopeptide repeat protein [Myxococcota bacterium]
ILKYLNGEAKIWPIPLPSAEVAAKPSVRALALDEIAARLGIVALVGGELEIAQGAFDAALAANPTNTVALVGAADLHKFAGRWEQAEPLYLRAIELEPDNPYHKLDYGEFFYDRARAPHERDMAQAQAWVVEARRQFARSYQLDDSIPETLAMNGATYLGDPDGAERAIASLEAASDLAPSQPQIKFLLAQAYAHAERKHDALRLIRSLVAWSHAGGSDEATAFLQALETDAQASPDSEQKTPSATPAEEGASAP